MCGEKKNVRLTKISLAGSPPHVRGKAHLLAANPLFLRITPACAGKSTRGTDAHKRPWDHPRMCGEKIQTRRKMQ